ncbi:hypothetical protein JCM19233_7301 [Vibrio astriarenae]|nr:hypothetical protein JCM19233_7301 [Vibrio sp. C7]
MRSLLYAMQLACIGTMIDSHALLNLSLGYQLHRLAKLELI